MPVHSIILVEACCRRIATNRRSHGRSDVPGTGSQASPPSVDDRRRVEPSSLYRAPAHEVVPEGFGGCPAAWSGACVLDGDLVDAVRALRAAPGGDVLMHGFGPIARTLTAHGLLDELHLWIHPVLVGGNRQDLLHRADLTAVFTPAGTTVLDSGVVVLALRGR
ncbi:MAG: dihydrofolate reductase family protein [Pseudonocardia sp.]|nr:dihydrofolate reductase family protein [Pseudonocardia sp.]